MLLTLPWLGGLILGRVDIVNGEGQDKQTSKFSLKSFYKQVGSYMPFVNLCNTVDRENFAELLVFYFRHLASILHCRYSMKDFSRL